MIDELLVNSVRFEVEIRNRASEVGYILTEAVSCTCPT